ncbi:hypothetical protein QQS21_006713 [Conoideocrella luteorostrata]|uniref:Uncharacterized protein n=1 Tax=Conoideocrella luteorostrata TaxID=1105319 RepID=A0AAJ0CM63_9HYPO|nr:hypothetical protein QQS21_006713 [Conoideocrella luteorostrata]
MAPDQDKHKDASFSYPSAAREESSQALLHEHETHAIPMTDYSQQQQQQQKIHTVSELEPGIVKRPTNATFREMLRNPRFSPPGTILRVYQQSNYLVLLQWVLAFFLLGSAARVVDVGDELKTSRTMGIVMLCIKLELWGEKAKERAQAIFFIISICSRLRYSSASAETPKPTASFSLFCTACFLLWCTSMGLGIAAVVLSRPYENEKNMDVLTNKGCGKRKKRPCHPATRRAGVFPAAVMCMSVAAASCLLGVLQIWILSSLWRGRFSEDAVRIEYEHRPGNDRVKVSFRQAWKDGWKQGWKQGREK